MKKKTKKIIAIICSIVMVVSSMTITGINKVEAANDYSKLTPYNAITNNEHPDLNGTSLYGSKYAFDGSTVPISPFQYQDAGNKQLYMAFPGEWAAGLKAVVNGTEIAGSGNQIFVNNAHEKFRYEYNVIEVSSNAGSTRLIIWCPANAGKGTYEGGSEPSSSGSEEPSDYAWINVGHSTTLQYYVKEGNLDVTPQVSSEEVSLAVRLGAPFESVVLNGESITPETNAYVRFNKSKLETGAQIYTLIVTAADGNTTATILFKNTSENQSLQPVDIITLVGNVDIPEQVSLTWTVDNPPAGQTYNIYLDGNARPIASGILTNTYTLEGVAKGDHSITVKAILNGTETEGKTIPVTVKAKPVIKFDTELAQVTTSGTVNVDGTWSYDFQSADAMFAVNSESAFIAYLPTCANAEVDKVYQTINNLVVGKTYKYTYVVDTDVAGNNIPVVASMGESYSDSYTLTDIQTTGVTVTKKFTATATTMQIAYTLGYINNAAAVKISKATVTELKPKDITSLTAEGGIESIVLTWECADAEEEQRYNIYLDSNAEPVQRNVNDTKYTLTGITKGNHSVTVKAVLNGMETEGKTVSDITVTKVDVAITSDSITVEGFQIKTNNPDKNTVGFRTICKAPNVDSQIVASDGKIYTVASMGTIYTLDPNTTGYRKNDRLNASYTILNTTPVNGNEYEYTYVGANLYNEEQCTYGYLATDEGIAVGWKPSDNANTYYVRTMLDMNTRLENSIYVRAFVIAADGTFIYGKKTACISVAEVADHLYKNSKSNNYTAHKYLYSNILNKVSTANPYRRDTTLPYGWDSQLFTPSNPTFTLTDGTLDDWNNK